MIIARSLIALAAFVAISLATARVASAQDAVAPAYSRSRMRSSDWQSRGGGNGWGGRPGNPSYGYGFNPYYYSPFIAGTWYTRPYPYHFDYYRWRWGGDQPHNLNDGEAHAPADCPCTTEAAQPESPTPPAPAAESKSA